MSDEVSQNPLEDYDRENAALNAQLQAFLAEHGALAMYHLGSFLNWDTCEPTLLWMVQHPDCPKAVASRLFWLSGVEYVVAEAGSDYQPDTQIMEAILKRWKAGDYRAHGWGDPEPEATLYEIDYYRNSDGVRAAGNPLGIPDDLFELVKGPIPDCPPHLKPPQNPELNELLLDLGMFFGED
ncbi:MAG: DUF4274 domain-containing protein [Pseudomonadota bacterium]